MPQKIIIDADPGIGDAVAIVLALQDSNLDVMAVTATAGCVAGSVATRNVQAIVELLDPPKWPRLGSSGAPAVPVDLNYRAAAVSPVDLNGPNGLGDFRFSVAELHNPHESAKLMVDLARTYPNEVTLLTLGPLTNIELACERAPEFLDLLKGIVCLGGSVTVGGDVTAAAEYNIYANPEAARNVLCSLATKTLVPLDVSSQLTLTFEQMDRLPSRENSAVGHLLHETLPFAFRAHHQHLGVEGVRLPEVMAVAALSQPRLFSTHSMALDIETQGELTRGMTVFDRRGIQRWQTNIDVVDDADAQGVLDYMVRTLSRAE